MVWQKAKTPLSRKKFSQHKGSFKEKKKIIKTFKKKNKFSKMETLNQINKL